MNVQEFFTRGGQKRTVAEVDNITSEATQVNIRTIRRLRQEKKASPGGIFHSPRPRARIAKVTGQLDDTDKECVRREVLSFYDRGKLPTLSALLTRVKEPPVNYNGSRSSLHTIIRDLGFRYRTTTSGRKILMERSDIVIARNKFLRELKQNRESEHPRQEVYLDETWVNQSMCMERCCPNEDGSAGPRVKSGKGGRLIIIHAGSEEGFVPEALLKFQAQNGNKGDYHDSIDHKIFKTWFENQLLPNISNRSLIMMDNAPYHSNILNKVPTLSFKKTQVIEWLTANNIAHDPSYTKIELIDICKHHREKQKYEIDNIAEHCGHKILRMPPYHCVFNPIELIWAQMKTEAKKMNSDKDQSMKQLEILVQEAAKHVTQQHWENAIRHVRKIEDEYRAKDTAMDHLLDSFVINTDSSQSSSSEDECMSDN